MKTIGVFAIGSLGCVVALACGSWAVELAGRSTASVDQVVALGAAVLAAALGAWYGLTAVVVVLLRLAGESRHRAVVALRRAAGALGAPVLRRAVAAGAGAGLLLGISPAVADSGAAPGEVAPVLAQSAESEREVPADLRPGFLPDPGPEPESAGVATSTEETDTESDPPAPEPTAPGAAGGPEAPSAPPSAPPGPPTGAAAANPSATARGSGPGATTGGAPGDATAGSAASRGAG